MRSLNLLLLLFLLLLLAPPQVFSQEQTVQVKGMAAIIQGDQALARDNAVNDGLRKAVEQAIGTIVSAETVVENYQLISDSILTKSQGYIKSYNVVSESPSDNLYQVTLSAVVAAGSLKGDLGALGILMQRKQKPRIMFLMAEQNVGQEYYVYWWARHSSQSGFTGQQVDLNVAETILKEEFINQGFNVVDPHVAAGKIRTSNAYKMADLSNDAARELGKSAGAEVVIKGKVLAKEGVRRGSSVGSYMADMTTTAVRVDNGAVLGSARGHGVARHISPVTGGSKAIENAAKEVHETLIDQIIQKWSSEVSAGQLVQITVTGIQYYSDFVKFKDVLKGQVRGVQAIYQRSLSGGKATLDVETKTSAQEMADEIARKNFGMTVRVLGMSGNTLEISLGSP